MCLVVAGTYDAFLDLNSNRYILTYSQTQTQRNRHIPIHTGSDTDPQNGQ